MAGFPTMSPIFGVFFALAGLALAVFLGMVLYPEKKPETDSAQTTLTSHEEAETV